ncbi:PKD domain-containing protein [Actinomadura sp. KC06]|uniref:beta-propeller fold lactonase family protein n=1 Tax=Actinomadura sp. KC06 TaxID=2530369 RepID=UPI001046E0BC|nr:beta-propeller fold lactonase family protein [Actinomadura sp. KC06]TDD26783.1 PKD domain-containing protein [Actinomadura sp. KC06]
MGRLIAMVLVLALSLVHSPVAAADETLTRPLYVTNFGPRPGSDLGPPPGVSVFAMTRDGQAELTGPLVEAGGQLRGIVLAPDGRHAYVAGTTAGSLPRLTTFAVGGDGDLTPTASTQLHDTEPFGIAIAPDGRNLYVTGLLRNLVEIFQIAGDGSVRPLGDPVTVPVASPRGVAISPNGRFLFVSHGRPSDSEPDVLTVYARRADGGISPIGEPVAVGATATGIGVTPDGRFLYVANHLSNSVSGFAVGADGRLSAIPGSPFPAFELPTDVAITPDGRHLYVSAGGSHDPEFQGFVLGFSIATDGRLTPVPGGRFRAGQAPSSLSPTPDGRHLVVSSHLSSDITVFRVARNGTLDRRGPNIPTTGQDPAFQAVTFRPNAAPRAAFSADQDGTTARFDATASSDRDGRVARFDWDFGDGTRVSDAGPQPVHEYAEPGVYRVTLTVTDDENCSTTQIYTGQKILCDGDSAARTSQELEIM